MLDNSLAHDGIPEIFDVIDDIPFGLFCVRISNKKIANVIGHDD
jgi:hypothetical protein